MGSDRYYLSLKASIGKRYLVHRAGCPFMPGREQRIFLGEFDNTEDPENESRKHGMIPRKCRFCCSSGLEAQPSAAKPLIRTVPEERWDSALFSSVN